MEKVEAVREGMRQGNYYEVVLRQTFSAPFAQSPSELFLRIQKSSPSPYEFIMQMGDEQLVGASPEMFVRVEDRPGRDVPDCGNGATFGRPDSRCGEYSSAAEFGERRIGADDVQRCGPQ